MVYNSVNYPHLIALFEELNVKGIGTEMGFSVSLDDGAFEWCGETFGGLLSSFSNIWNLEFYKMMFDILKFNREAIKYLQNYSSSTKKDLTIGEFMYEHKLSSAFSERYFIPMTAAIWSASSRSIMNFPAYTMLSFLKKYGLFSFLCFILLNFHQ
jgi:predicted NAD/FAD-binding protein